MHKISVAGLVCVDLRPELDESARFAPGRLIEIGPLSMQLGGMVGNSGVNLLDLGAPLRLECGVGDDELGQYVRDSLRVRGADIGGIRSVVGVGTSYSLILEPHGVDRTIWHSIGANAMFDGSEVDINGVDILHVGYPALLPALVVNNAAPINALLTRARAAGVTTSVDLSFIDTASAAATLDWHSILPLIAAQTDVMSPSLDDLTSALRIDEPFSTELIDRMLTQLLEWGVAVAAISAGDQGLFVRTAGADRFRRAGRALADHAELWADHEISHPPTYGDTPVTTNGAGDASSAGLLYGIAAGFGPEHSARLAAACSGALVSGQRTTFDVISEMCPDLADLLTPASKGQ
jgi:sugar/nucleoside kinase (ribokinase family)